MHVSFVPSGTDPFPTTLPMLGVLGTFPPPSPTATPGPLDIYLHGWVSTRLTRLTDDDEGLPVSVSSAHIDGLVLAFAPFDHSVNYRSAVVHGYAKLLTDPAERLYALERLTDAVVPERWTNARSPPTDAELKSTAVVRVRIETASAKVRRGGPKSSKGDIGDESVRGRVWTGVVPVKTVLGEPVPARENVVSLPAYLRTWVEEENERAAKQAEQANAM